MKILLPWLFVLICFTAPDGSPVWIAKEQVVAIVRSTSNANLGALSQIDGSNGRSYYVKETPDQVAAKVR